MLVSRITTAILLLSSDLTFAQPSYGTLIGSSDGDILRYECQEDGAPGKLTCRFTQVLLSNNSDEDDLQNQLIDIPAMLADASTFEGCEELVDDFADVISRAERGEPMADGRLVDMDANELEYSKRLFASFASMCSDKSEESLEGFFRLTHEREAITCRPFVQDYHQVFTRVDERLWVVDDGPTGKCGIVQVSTFEQSEGDGFLWEYTAQRIITNPSGISETGFSCSALSEEPILYTWRSDAQRIDCTFIE